MSDEFDLKDLERRMDGALAALKTEFASLRTGRASASILDTVMVAAYGNPTPINQVGTVGVPEPRMISVSVWDKGLIGSVDKAIRNSGLGLNPVVDGTLIRIPIPELNEERRTELAKVAHQYAENGRISVRNVRRDGMDKLKKAEKNGDMSEDEHKAWSDEVQTLTDLVIERIDESLKAKETEIMQV